MSSTASRGRPTGAGVDRREQIRAAATQMFADLGYDRTTIRAVASAAGVDPKLVAHYFGNKAALFAACMIVPDEVWRAQAAFANVPRSEWGQALCSIVIDEDGRFTLPHLLGVVRSASSDAAAAETIRDFYEKNLLEGALEHLGVDNHRIRATVLSALLIGLTFSDQVVNIPVGGSEAVSRRRQLVAAVIQKVLTEDIR